MVRPQAGRQALQQLVQSLAGSVFRIGAATAGEITPTIAALCVLADGPSRLSGIGHLRGHETDRLAAIEAEVHKLGGECTATEDSLEFGGLPKDGLNAAVLETYHDHRMATFAAIIGLSVQDVKVINVGTTSKTMPKFPSMWLSMLDGAQ